MGDRKKTACLKGHPLEEPNLVFNGEGFRECKRCKYDRRNKRRREERREQRTERAFEPLPRGEQEVVA